jgi:TldD protein
MTEMADVIDAAEYVLDSLEAHDEVAYAEVGGIARDQADVVVTEDGVRTATEFRNTGVWWRLFADGVADYRHSGTLERDYIDEEIERSVRSGRVLGQNEPARYDAGSVHRSTHPGWADAPLDGVDADDVAADLSGALDDSLATASTDVSRARANYSSNHESLVLLTTTGTTLQTTLDRASTESVVASDRLKVTDHAGSTSGRAFLDRVPGRFDDVVDRLDRAADADEADPDDGRLDVALSPHAAASLFHALSHYFELDMRYFGATPFDVGDRIGPESLTVSDVVRPGSWTARAFDAEGKPTQPVTLVENGVVRNFLYDTVSAIEEEAHPAGTLVPTMGWEESPRIHARHLDVDAGRDSAASLREDADVLVTRIGEARFDNEATRTKRSSTMPPSVLYAKNIREMTPSDYEDEADEQSVSFPVVEGFTLDGAATDGRFDGGRLSVSLDDIASLAGLSAERETATGTCAKHHSMLPWAATAPGLLFETTLDLS